MAGKRGGLSRLKDLVELAGRVDPEDIERLKRRAETLESLLRELVELQREHNRLLRELLEAVRRGGS